VTAGASDGRRRNGHNVSAGKRSPPRGAGTPIPEDWWPRKDVEYAFAKSKGYSVEATVRMAEKFRAYHRKKRDKSMDWSVDWEFWVLNEPTIRGGERPVKLDATGKPIEKLDSSII
jgi:hypothetical protein